MLSLTVINQNGTFTIDSREVAEMVEKEHDQLLRSIRGYVEVLNSNPSAKLQTAQFFIDSTYIDKQNQERPCFLITKKGCDMVANKMTGEKGILFTAAYVTKFEEMENSIKLPQNYKQALLALVAAEEEKEQLLLTNSELKTENKLLSQETLTWADRKVLEAIVKAYGASIHLPDINGFQEAWRDFKKELLYNYGINLNSRISKQMESSNRKAKPKTMDMIHDDELPRCISTSVALCKSHNVDISDIINKYSKSA